MLNILKPKSRIKEEWPHCSFFAIYSGYNGSFTSEFLKENLHKYITQQPFFPSDPARAIQLGFASADKAILALQARNPGDKSGSSAVVAATVGEVCYVAHVGDSRAVLEVGGEVCSLGREHRVSEGEEQARVLAVGGRISW